MKLDVDIDTLSAEACNIEKQLVSMDEVIKNARGLLVTLQQCWEGDAAQEYFNQLNTHIMNCEELSSILWDLLNAINAQVEDLRNNDNFFGKHLYEIKNIFIW